LGTGANGVHTKFCPAIPSGYILRKPGSALSTRFDLHQRPHNRENRGLVQL
jgi:hypothetical protein